MDGEYEETRIENLIVVGDLNRKITCKEGKVGELEDSGLELTFIFTATISQPSLVDRISHSE